MLTAILYACLVTGILFAILYTRALHRYLRRLENRQSTLYALLDEKIKGVGR